MTEPKRSIWTAACAILLIVCVHFLAIPGREVRAGQASFSTLVDSYLDWFALHHPSIAAGNGLHQHDDRLEDFSAPAVRREIADLKRWRERLRAINAASLPADERVDHRILEGIIDGWLLDLETVQTWRRNPMVYATAITDGVHNLMNMESSPTEARMCRIIAKLKGVDSLLAAARQNVVNPPRILAERGLAMFRGASTMLRRDLLLAFRPAGNAALEAGLKQAGVRAAQAVDRYASHLEREVIPRASGAVAIGKRNLEARYRDEELIDLPADHLLAIGERELKRVQEQFRATAARLAPGKEPMEAWEAVMADHPARGALVPAAERALGDLLAFIRTKRLMDLPPHDPVVVAEAPEYELGLAAMHSSPPLEPTPVKSFYYITDARPDWTADAQDAWLRKFNYATLSDITAHEVYPGHFAHSLFMRRTPGKIRRIWIGLNPLPQPSSGQDGWAHYAEQMILDEGFHADDPRYRLAQLSEALTRICRLIVGIRIHTGSWTVEDGARCFEQQAHLPGPAARQEAERATYDPTYGGYFLGKLALLKLRRDVAEREGESFDLRRFHERVMTNGIAPWWAHRQLLLPGDTSPVLE
jgi:uncharacterized protein (DUF885 family)